MAARPKGCRLLVLGLIIRHEKAPAGLPRKACSTTFVADPPHPPRGNHLAGRRQVGEGRTLLWMQERIALIPGGNVNNQGTRFHKGDRLNEPFRTGGPDEN